MKVLAAVWFAACLKATICQECIANEYSLCVANGNNAATCKATTELFDKRATCGCNAQVVGVCAMDHNCTSSCLSAMASEGCEASWCTLSLVTKTTRLTTVYRFAKETNATQVQQILQPILDYFLAINLKTTIVVSDVSIPTPTPTLQPGATQQDVDRICSEMVYTSDCEKGTMGYCKWTGAECVHNGARISSQPAAQQEVTSSGNGPWDATVQVVIQNTTKLMHSDIPVLLSGLLDSVAASVQNAELQRATITEVLGEGSASPNGSQMSTGTAIAIMSGIVVSMLVLGFAAYLYFKREHQAENRVASTPQNVELTGKTGDEEQQKMG